VTGDAHEHGVGVAPGVFLPENALNWSYARSGGPGGQHVNKVATKAVLRLSVGSLEESLDAGALDRLRRLAGSRLTHDDEIVISAEDSRSQRANRESCLEKLRDLIVRAKHRPRPRKRTRPSKASKQRRIDAKKQRGAIKRMRRKPRDSD